MKILPRSRHRSRPRSRPAPSGRFRHPCAGIAVLAVAASISIAACSRSSPRQKSDQADGGASPSLYASVRRMALSAQPSPPQPIAIQKNPTGVPFLVAPWPEAQPRLGDAFIWTHSPVHSRYQLFVKDTATDTIVHAAPLVPAAPLCDAELCTLTSDLPGYPALSAIDYAWWVMAFNSGTRLWEWSLNGATNYVPFHPMLEESTGLSVAWVGDDLRLDWPAASGAAAYHASFMNWAHVTSSELFAAAVTCAGATCSATAEVKPIPYGTVHVRLRVCGANGVCTPGITADAHKACPTAIPEPALLSPAEGSRVNGLTTLRWREPTAAERYAIQFERDDGAGTLVTVKDEVLWRSQVPCHKQADGVVCERSFGLADGNYQARISADCGGDWGPTKTVAFTVDAAAAPIAHVAPRIWSPGDGATTSIEPVILWSRIADLDSYELVIDQDEVSRKYPVTCKTEICSFDHAAHGIQLRGAYTFGVRINEPGMPLSPVRGFTASLAYLPPAAVPTGPYQRQNVGTARAVAVQYDGDVQVPFSSVAVTGPAGYAFTSPVVRRASCSYAKKSAGVVQRCSVTAGALSAAGRYEAAIRSGTHKTAGGSVSWSPPPTPVQFTRDAPAPGFRAIYSVFSQNAQFLPATGPFGHGGGASSAWGLSDRQRAAKLKDYVTKKGFDVVVLEEVFVEEAQTELAKLLKHEYPYYAAHIDTAGIASVDEMFAEQDSGLAIFSKFAPEYVAPGATSNYQGTSDKLNEIDDVATTGSDALASFKVNDFMWFKQYGKCEGTDCMAAKGIAGIRLANPKTGAPLFVAWTHTQSATDNITDAYDALAQQIHDDARPVVELMRAGAPPVYDALLLGDWNLNMPASVGRHPKFDGLGTNNQSNGGGEIAALYSLDSVDRLDAVVDPKNPRFDALLPDPPAAVGEPAGGLPKTIYQQYRLAFDPRHANPPFPGFHDLWLENPQGDPGLTFDVTGRRSHIACTESDRETCGQRHYSDAGLDRFDTGSRYDAVLARFSKSNIPHAPGGGSYPNAPVNWESGSCVQRVSLARDYLFSDHFGTIIEVGPAAPHCNPATAKADPHLWRVPNSQPLPDPNKRGFDKEAGVHDGHFAHGGANEWFFIREPGAFDIVNEGPNPGMGGIIVEAFLATDLSDPIAVADATQHVDGFLPGAPGCNKEINEVSIGNADPETGGVIADACAGAETRVTYRVPPGGLYLRITPADPARAGQRCETCTGDYHVRFRERTCRAPKEAITVSSGVFNFGLATAEKGWFGLDQRQCWFQIELQAPTSGSDFQTLEISNIGSMSNQACVDHVLSGGTCSLQYEAEVYKSKGEAEADRAMPGTHFTQAATLPPASEVKDFLVDDAWALTVERATGRKAYYVKVKRDDASRPHDAFLNYESNLKSVVFQVVSTTNIEDDYLTTLCLPFLGCAIVNDPFNNTDELRIRQFINGEQVKFDDVELNVDNQGGDYFKFPDRGPDGQPIEVGTKRGYGGTWKTDDKIGTWTNYTASARVEATEQDDFTAWDWVVADHLQCGKTGQTAPPGGWQAAQFDDLWKTLPMTANATGSRLSSATFDHSDVCGGDEGRTTWEYKFRAAVYRPQ